MKRTSHAVLRVAASALVVLIWVIYLFERWSGQYAMYPLIGYVGYECLSIAAGACFWALLIWLLAVLRQVLRRKAPKRDLAFAALLAVMLSAMSVYNTWLSGFSRSPPWLRCPACPGRTGGRFRRASTRRMGRNSRFPVRMSSRTRLGLRPQYT